MKAFESAGTTEYGTPVRKVILATNIAETSITIPGIKYVIDCGLQKMRVFKASSGIDSLQVLPISKNSATQRAGRAGREQAGGKCFRLYTSEAFGDLDENTVPEILRCNISGIILNLKAMGIEEISSIDFIDRPSQQSFLKGFETLIKFKAIDQGTAKLTKLGHEMAVLPTEPIYSKLLVTALSQKYTSIRSEVVGIVSMLSVENIFFSPSLSSKSEHDQFAISKKRAKLLDPRGDHLGLLNIFR
mmetsp:Transcript_31673/g.48464  ORF Transcript_31673/g.48464 Transcript_31673/m.48464 type:complete len:245 (-) Transcript_31673:480-1214(-)